LVIMSEEPFSRTEFAESMFRIFSARAATELERNRAEVSLLEERSNLENTVALRTEELETSFAQLKNAFIEMEVANRSQNKFLSTVSHELHAPLTAILGFSELLLAVAAGVLSDKQHKYTERIGQSGQHLLELVNGLLDMAKIDVNATELQYELINTSEYVNSLIEMMQTQLL
jgi:signal transduction histidine kinase